MHPAIRSSLPMHKWRSALIAKFSTVIGSFLHNKKYKTRIQPLSQDFFPLLKFENFPPLQILKKG